jgi:hypothetical protein
MRCHVVLDKEGKICAIAHMVEPKYPELEVSEVKPGAAAPDYPVIRGGPEAEDGQQVLEIDLPIEDIRSMKEPTEAFMERLQADIQAKSPSVKGKK